MKYFAVYLCFILTLISFKEVSSQEELLNRKNLATVYFVRVANYAQHAQFMIFENENLININEGINWFKYECEPGDYLFWITNRKYSDFVEASLEAGESYMLMIDVRIGYGKASTRLRPKKPGDEGYDRGLELIKNTLQSQTSAEDLGYKVKNLNKRNIIEKQLEYYKTDWKFPTNYIKLDSMYYLPKDSLKHE